MRLENNSSGITGIRSRSHFASREFIGRIIATVIIVKIVLLFTFALNTRFVMDEFQQLGWAKYLGNGFFDTIWPAKTVGAQVFYKLAHLIGQDATTILLIGRLQTAILACAILTIVYACARALGYDRLRSILTVLVLLSFSNFIERSFRTIAEPLAVFFAAAALLVTLKCKVDRARVLLAAGALCGLSVLVTQKSAYFCIALGVALVADALIDGRIAHACRRGAWMVGGWIIPILAYCFLFGGADPVPMIENLFLGPVEVATNGANPYPGGLRHFVAQTLSRNGLLYLFCFSGMLMLLVNIRRLNSVTRIALIFSTIITLLVFLHNQPWPYVFIMALPFVALWAVVPLDILQTRKPHFGIAAAMLSIAVGVSFVRNVVYLDHSNAGQLDVVARAEALIGPDEEYFDGVGMLPNRQEPSTLWLDRASALRVMADGSRSEVYEIFRSRPPKLVIWSGHLKRIEPLVAPILRDGYVAVSPNLRVAGRLLRGHDYARFTVIVPGIYELYDANGRASSGPVEIDGTVRQSPVELVRGDFLIRNLSQQQSKYLLLHGDYDGKLRSGAKDKPLFKGVYD